MPRWVPVVDERGDEAADDDAFSVGDRQRAAELRDQAGRQRDLAADFRDRAAQQRDHAADLEDEQALTRSRGDAAAHAQAGTVHPQDVAYAAPEQTVAFDRDRPRRDRHAAAGDRGYAQQDRSDAAADRSAAARDRHAASVDALTGVYSREAGLMELDREIARVARTGHPLVLAFLDVDHLKVINDSHGHAAGDRLLVQVAATLQTALRPYDLIVRYGGDEFLCAVQGIDVAAARHRFARVNALLAAAAQPSSVTIGVAQHMPDDSGPSLIARADADLYRQRSQRPN